MPKKKSAASDLEPKYSKQARHIIIACALLIFTGAIFLSTESGQRMLGFDPDATGSSANEGKFRKNERAIREGYIVVFQDNVEDVDAKANELNGKHLGQLKHTYKSAVKGFSTRMSEQQALAMSQEAGVAYVEEDGVVEPSAIQTNATWGISRIDYREPAMIPSDTNYEYYNTGQGVNVYVIDTGVYTQNPDFGGRAVKGVNTSGDNRQIDQCNGHGTHVAGTIGSTTYGVAKNVRIFDVQVFPCSGAGTVSDVVAGIDWVLRNAIRPAVANLSLTASSSSTLNQSVKNLITNNITATVAAGNYGADACLYSPASVAEALTTGSVYYTDERPSSTNYGRCVDLYAPGVNITSTWNSSTQTSQAMSGTSMATPHAAGVAALYLQSNPTATATQTINAIVNNATTGLVKSLDSTSNNRLLYSLFSTSTPPPTEPPPTACTNTYTGTVAGGAVVYHPTAGFSGRAGSYSGNLTSDSGAKLSLERKQGKNWNLVAQSPGFGTEEYLSYSGSKGTYRWKVAATSTTAYSLCANLP